MKVIHYIHFNNLNSKYLEQYFKKLLICSFLTYDRTWSNNILSWVLRTWGVIFIFQQPIFVCGVFHDWKITDFIFIPYIFTIFSHIYFEYGKYGYLLFDHTSVTYIILRF